MKHAFVKPSLAAISLLVVLTACSSTPSAKKLEKLAAEPVKLGDFTPSVQVDRVWTAQLGDGERSLGLGQQPVVADGHVYAAAAEGSVYALDLASGKEIWRFRPEERRKLGAAAEAERLADETSLPSLDDAETKSERQRIKAQIRGIKMERKLARKLAKRMAKEKLPWRFSGGPGAGDGLVVVGTLDGVVIALDAANGEEKWRAKVPNEVIAAPSIGQGYVLIRSNDGAVTALDAATGERRWTTPRELPALTVRGNAPVTLGPGVVFVGNDDGTLGALGLNDGRVLWQLPVGLPEGRSELERMADVDGAPLLEDTTVFASSYKKQTVAIDGPSGRPLWTRDNGGVGGLSVSVNGVLLADPGGVVWALDRYTGSGLWSNSNLVRRKLTGPTVQGDYAVLGDLEGYVHWLRLDNGDIAARERISRDAIRAKPVLAGDLLLVQDTEGKLAAYRLRQ